MTRHSDLRKRAIAVAALAAVLLCAVPGGASAADPPSDLLPAGTKAPLFETVDIDGAPYSFADDLARGPVFLVFWSIF